MDMQDKEFDELFRSKLDNLEMPPSANLWEGVNYQLNTGRRKKLLVPFLSIAASILVLISVGILVIPQKNNKAGKPIAGTDHNSMVNAGRPQTNIAPETEKVVTTAAPSSNGHQTSSANIAKTPANFGAKTVLDAVAGSKAGYIVKQKTVANAPHDNSVATPAPDLIVAVVPDTATHLSIKSNMGEPPIITKPILAANQLPLVNKSDVAPVKAKHKIRSLGDLINIAVASVDKRKDKIIEFSDTDDDESTITAVNLGLVRIKKAK